MTSKLGKTAAIPTEKVMVTARAKAPRNKSVLETPAGAADVEIISMSWWRQAAIRTARTYLQGFVGFILAGQSGAAAAVGVYLPAGDFLALCYSAGSLALAPAVISLIQNAIEILSRLDSPQTRA